MNKALTIFIIIGLNQFLIGQPNCEMYADSLCKKSCNIAWEASKYQGLKKSQELFDEAIKLCPGFAYSYFEKSVPYLKQGLFREWKELIDKAVELDYKYLLNRGINQVQFIRNYEEGLNDLDKLYSQVKTFEIGYSPSGEYHGQLIRAICYQKLGQLDKSIEVVEELVSSKNYHQGLFDYFHIGIIYLEKGNYEKAKSSFIKQIEENEFAEIYYYYSKIFRVKGDIDSEKKMLIKAKELYLKGQTMKNNYYHYIDQIFLKDIEQGLKKLN